MILCKLKLTLHGNDNKFLKQLELSSCEPLLYFNATTLKGFIDVNQDLEILLKYDNLNNASQFICHKIHKYLSFILIIYIYKKLFIYIYRVIQAIYISGVVQNHHCWFKKSSTPVSGTELNTCLQVLTYVVQCLKSLFCIACLIYHYILISVNIVNYAKNSQENYKRGGGCGIRYIIP